MSARAYLFTLAIIAMLGATPAIAFDGLKTPSGNIVCILDGTDDAPPALRCDIRNFRPTKLPPPKGCPLNWGDAFEISGDGKFGELACHSDTIMHEDVAVLPYGAVWHHDALTCVSEQSGLTCRNTQGHGFSISRSSQRLF